MLATFALPQRNSLTTKSLVLVRQLLSLVVTNEL